MVVAQLFLVASAFSGSSAVPRAEVYLVAKDLAVDRFGKGIWVYQRSSGGEKQVTVVHARQPLQVEEFTASELMSVYQFRRGGRIPQHVDFGARSLGHDERLCQKALRRSLQDPRVQPWIRGDYWARLMRPYKGDHCYCILLLAAIPARRGEIAFFDIQSDGRITRVLDQSY